MICHCCTAILNDFCRRTVVTRYRTLTRHKMLYFTEFAYLSDVPDENGVVVCGCELLDRHRLFLTAVTFLQVSPLFFTGCSASMD